MGNLGRRPQILLSCKIDQYESQYRDIYSKDWSLKIDQKGSIPVNFQTEWISHKKNITSLRKGIFLSPSHNQRLNYQNIKY